MKKRWLSIILTAAMVAGTVTPAAAAVNNGLDYKTKKSVVEKNDKVDIAKQITEAIVEQGVKTQNSEQRVKLLILSNGTDISSSLKGLGASVSKKSTSVYVAEIEANKAMSIGNIKGIRAVGKDRILSLPKPVDLKKIYPDGRIANPDLEYSHETTDITKFWRQGYDGKGTKVAIIDTGVEPGNEMLTATSDGKVKIVDYQDFWDNSGDESEGDVDLQELEVQLDNGRKFVSLQGVRIYVPDTAGDKVLFGYFNEGNLTLKDDFNRPIFHDVNNNTTKDMIPVLVTNYKDAGDKTKDNIYVDTNLNNNLSDEKPMGIYRDTMNNIKDKSIFQLDSNGKVVADSKNNAVVKDEYKSVYSRLINNFADLGTGNNPPGTSFNFVVTRVTNEGGKWIVNLGYDGNSHGTHVAGDAAGNGYRILPFVDTTLRDSDGKQISDGTLKGAAPGAQVIACRVFKSEGGTPESAYMAAMEYSCENGADVINMSLGSLPDIDDGTDPSSMLANQLSKKYGTVFCISAGNEGPGTNSIGTPGTSEWAITVGAYNPAWLNYGYKWADNGLWYFSSRGPTEDGRLKPTIIAPGSMISSMPVWQKNKIRGKEQNGGDYVGYGLEQGTSMSSPYTAGTVAAIKQAINQEGIPYHPLVLKEALFETGDKTIDKKVYTPTEIGGGMINPNAALTYLEALKNKGLNQSSLKGADGYTDRNTMNLKTEFDYTEKLDYKPEGLYVRSGDIPDSVNVTITNTEGKDLNLSLSKDSYNYSNEWLVLPQDKLQIKKGEAKTLNLKIDKTKLNMGINSLLIKMDDGSTLLKDATIPVTVINYLDLNAEKPTVSESQERTFAPGAVSKHFIRIPYGVQKAEIEIDMTDGSDTSNLKPLITNPEGLQDENLANISNISALQNKVVIPLSNPEAGTWEVDLLSTMLEAKDMANATGKHTITAKLKGVSFGPSVINYSGKSGEYKESDMDLKVLNATGINNQQVTLRKTNLVSEDANKTVVRNTIENGKKNIIPFSIPDNDPNLFVNIQTGNAANKGDDVDVYLYRMINGKLGSPVALSGNSGSEEKVYVENLPAGDYSIVVSAAQTAATTSYDLTYQIANSSFGENDINIKTDKLTMGTELASTKLGVRVPVKKGKYMGLIYAMDNDGNVLGKAKVKAVSEGTENSVALSVDKASTNPDNIIRTGKDFQLNLQGDIKDASKFNNIYGVQFTLNFDPTVVSATDIISGDMFKGTDTREISRKVENGKITYVVGFINAKGEKDATGAISGNIAKIKMNAKAVGKVTLSFDKLLVVNYLGEEVALNTVMNNDLSIVNPDFIQDGVVNIRDICKLAYLVGKSKGDVGYDERFDLNKDNVIDYKDLNFMINCFNEDN